MPTLHSNNPVPSNGSVATVIRGAKSISMTLSGVGAVRAVVQIMAKEDGAAPGPIGNQIVVSGTTTVTTTQTFNADAGQVYLQLIDITPNCKFSATLTELGPIQDTNPGSASAPFASAADLLASLPAGPSEGVGGEAWYVTPTGEKNTAIYGMDNKWSPSRIPQKQQDSCSLFIIGDSVSTFSQSGGWLANLILISKGYFFVGKNVATASMGIAHVISTQLPQLFGAVFDEITIEIGTNDTGNYASFEDSYRTVIANLYWCGKPIRAFAIPPKLGSGLAVSEINEIQRRVLKEFGLCLIDLWDAIRAFGNNPVANSTIEGTHPSDAACAAAAQIIITKEPKKVGNPVFASSAYPAIGNKFQYPGLLVGAGGVATGIVHNTASISTGTSTPSLRADLRGFNWQDLTIAALPANAQVSVYLQDVGGVGVAVTPGAKYRFCAKLSLTGCKTIYLSARAQWFSSAPSLIIEESQLSGQVICSDGVLIYEVTAPPLAAWARPFLLIGNHPSAAAADSCVFSFALPQWVLLP